MPFDAPRRGGKNRRVRIEAIREHVRSRRFRPFELHLVDGKVLAVPHPEFVLFAPSAPEFVVVTPENEFNILDAASVARIRPKPVGKSAAEAD